MTENNFTYVPLAEPIQFRNRSGEETIPLVSTYTGIQSLFIRDCLDGILMQKPHFGSLCHLMTAPR